MKQMKQKLIISMREVMVGVQFQVKRQKEYTKLLVQITKLLILGARRIIIISVFIIYMS